jgi:hypothetical protein
MTSLQSVLPGRGLGWLTLGSSLHGVLTRIKSQSKTYPEIDLTYSSSTPVLQPVVISLPQNGLRLRFDGPDQRLRLIEVLDFAKTQLTYKSIELVRKSKPSDDALEQDQPVQGPTFRHVYNRLFGPAYEGEYIPPISGESMGTYVLSYPGLAFTFEVKHSQWSDKADFVTILSSSATSPAISMAIFSGQSWPEVRDSLYTTTAPFPRSSASSADNLDAIADEVEEVRIHGAGKIEFARRSTASTIVQLSQTTPQDLIAEFGPPDAIFRKHDNRISIHAASRRSSRRRPSASSAHDHALDSEQSSARSYTDESEIDSRPADEAEELQYECFYNYFHHGFDALISTPVSRSPPFPGIEAGTSSDSSSADLVVTKLVLHGNIPGSYSFNRHRRSRWKIMAPDDSHVHSEMPFTDISATMKNVWRSWYSTEEEEKKMQRGMVLNRGWDESPNSSIELLGSFEESTPTKPSGEEGDDAAMHNTELFGFPGTLFEVLKNDTVTCLTVY